MRKVGPTRQRLAALGLLGIPLLTYPLLGLPSGTLAGIPMIVIYLFTVWACLIVLAAWVTERRGE